MSDRRQRQREQRAAKRQAEKKREQRRELGRRLTTALIFGLVVVGIFTVTSLGGDESDLPRSYEGFRVQPTACGATQPPPESAQSFDAPEPQNDITASSQVTATLVTSCGEIVIELDPASSPATVNSFVFLAREGFYAGQAFHRITEGFRIETGDPEANGTGGPGYVIPDEFKDEDFEFSEGVVAMDNRGARSSGSRFFIIVGDGGRVLTPQFNVLGRVTEGMDTIERILAVPTEQSVPLKTVYIESVTIDVADS